MNVPTAAFDDPREPDYERLCREIFRQVVLDLGIPTHILYPPQPGTGIFAASGSVEFSSNRNVDRRRP
jgi:hypothetical protein